MEPTIPVNANPENINFKSIVVALMLFLICSPSEAKNTKMTDIKEASSVQNTVEQKKIKDGSKEKSIEGWVKLTFDISKAGSVENPKVDDSHPKGLFDKAAIKAIKKWKYKPKIVNGEAVTQKNLRIRLELRLDN